MVHFGLIGARLGHSLSPQIHQLIFKELGVEGTYDLLEIPPEELYASVHELRGKYCGVNVTIPHKVAVMDYLDTLRQRAEQDRLAAAAAARPGELIAPSQPQAD